MTEPVATLFDLYLRYEITWETIRAEQWVPQSREINGRDQKTVLACVQQWMAIISRDSAHNRNVRLWRMEEYKRSDDLTYSRWTEVALNRAA